jgi:O-antigen ligase
LTTHPFDRAADLRFVRETGVSAGTVKRWLPPAGTDSLAERASPRFTLVTVGLSVVALPLLIPVLPGNSALVDLAAIAAIASCVVWATSVRATVHVPYVVPVGIIVVSGALATFLGSYPLAGVQAILQDLFLLGWAATLATVARTPHALSTITGVWSWSAVAWAALLVLATMTGQDALAGIDTSEGTRAALTFGDQNGAAAYFAIALVVILACGRPRRLASRCAGVTLVVIALALTGSLAGIVSVLTIIVMVSTASAWRRWGLAPAIAISLAGALVGGALLWLVNTPHLVDEASASRFAFIRDSLGRGRQSSGTRAILARETAHLIRTGPPIGRGPGATKPSMEALQAPYPKEAHNDFAAALVERGIGGLLGVVLLFGAVVWRMVAVAVQPLASAFARVVPRPYVLLGALPSVMVFAVTHEVLHDRTVWTFFGLVAAVYLWSRAETATAKGPM